jgi:hypothetical protein
MTLISLNPAITQQYRLQVAYPLYPLLLALFITDLLLLTNRRLLSTGSS